MVIIQNDLQDMLTAIFTFDNLFIQILKYA